MSIAIRDAKTAYNYLNGVFCIYKAKKMPYRTLYKVLSETLCIDLNQLETRPAKERIQIIGNVGVNKNFSIQKTLSLADHPLVVGERYRPKDISLKLYQNLGLYVSGVNLIGIGEKGCYDLLHLKEVNLIKEYEITCRLGMATDTFFEQGKVIAESKFKYVTPHKINTVCNRFLNANSRYVLKSLGCSINSQEAYELLSKGPLRPPRQHSDPVLYALKCIEFKEPYFKLKVTTVNENFLYFNHLVNKIGLQLKTHACVSKMTCTRMGKFTIDDALSSKELYVENIINNIAKNYEKVQECLQNKSFNENIKINNNLDVDKQMNFKSPLINS